VVPALEEQRNGEWRYLEFLQVTSWITAEIFLCEIPGVTRARQRFRPVGGAGKNHAMNTASVSTFVDVLLSRRGSL